MKKIIMLWVIAYLNFNLFAQVAQRGISDYEKMIVSGTKPYDKDVYAKYEQGYRAIQWHDNLIRDYLYSNEALDKLGYDVLIWNEPGHGDSKTYRKCGKGIIIGIKEYEGRLSITMEWFAENARNSGYFMTCNKSTSSQQNIEPIIQRTTKKREEITIPIIVGYDESSFSDNEIASIDSTFKHSMPYYSATNYKNYIAIFDALITKYPNMAYAYYNRGLAKKYFGSDIEGANKDLLIAKSKGAE